MIDKNSEKEEMIEKLFEQYKLSDQQHYKIYEIIKKYYLGNARTSEHPIAIIVGAQPGSGKGSLIGYAKNYFKDIEDMLIISTDDYKPFHPKASEIAMKYPTEYSAIVEADSSKWTSKILQEAIKNRYSFIFEATLKNERILNRIKELKENGFEVIVKGMAVSYLESLMSAFERYEKQVESRSWGRFFDPINYNYIYENIPNTIESIEKSELCDAVEIYKRGEDIKTPELIYANYKNQYKYKEKITNQEFKYNSAKEAIIDYRNIELKSIREGIQERVKILEKNLKGRKLTKKEEEGLLKLKEISENY